MRNFFGLAVLGCLFALSDGALPRQLASPVMAQQSLYLAYPSANQQTTSDRIFFLGSAPPDGEVLVNGKAIARSPAGHFAPSFPLQLGENLFTVRYKDREVPIKVTRLS